MYLTGAMLAGLKEAAKRVVRRPVGKKSFAERESPY